MKIRKKDINNLDHSTLVEIVWELQGQAEWYAREYNKGYDDPWDLCVLTPGQIREVIEEHLCDDPSRG